MALNTTGGQRPHPEDNIRTRPWILSFVMFGLVLGFVVYYFSEIRQEVGLLESLNGYWLCTALAAQSLTYFFTAIIYRQLLAAC